MVSVVHVGSCGSYFLPPLVVSGNDNRKTHSNTPNSGRLAADLLTEPMPFRASLASKKSSLVCL